MDAPPRALSPPPSAPTRLCRYRCDVPAARPPPVATAAAAARFRPLRSALAGSSPPQRRSLRPRPSPPDPRAWSSPRCARTSPPRSSLRRRVRPPPARSLAQSADLLAPSVLAWRPLCSVIWVSSASSAVINVAGASDCTAAPTVAAPWACVAVAAARSAAGRSARSASACKVSVAGRASMTASAERAGSGMGSCRPPLCAAALVSSVIGRQRLLQRRCCQHRAMHLARRQPIYGIHEVVAGKCAGLLYGHSYEQLRRR